jgi:hypothetical protein
VIRDVGGWPSGLELLILAAYDRMVGLHLSDLATDGCSTKAPCGGQHARRSPVDRGKQGRKRSVVTQARGSRWARSAAGPTPTIRCCLPTLDTLERLDPMPTQPTVHLDRGYHSGKTAGCSPNVA